MTRIDFYHLQKNTLEEVLPKLVEKAFGLKQNIKIMVGNEERVEFLNTLLWTYNDESFLPHGSSKDGNAQDQPIFLSEKDDNPNQAQILFLVDGAEIEPEKATAFLRVLHIFEGNIPLRLEKARTFWKTLKANNFELHYYQQNDLGGWSEK